ncbi:MAG: beta-ketoacyl-[acyl-carrier-protein] synthase family protein [Pseudomonadota bacterium]
MQRRVVVTGIGLISPHGNDNDRVFDALMRGESAIRMWGEESGTSMVAAVVDFDVSEWFSKQQLSGVDRVSQFAVAAAQRALEDAELADLADPERCGVYFGSGMGGAKAIEDGFAAYFGHRRLPPLSVVAFMCNAPAAHIAMRHKITGPVLTYSVACASSAIALGEAMRAIARGEIDVAVAGGAEALVQPGVMQVWRAMKVLATPDPNNPALSCKPFSTERSGLVLAEGAAVLLLESLESAQARGARIYAELAGYAVRCDAYHLTKPDIDGQVRTLRVALRDAGLTPAQIGYCNAHGTATRLGDVVEAAALQVIWGEHLAQLRVGSTKSMHGHMLGAAGAMEAAITALSLYKRAIPAHLCGAPPDPECALSLVGAQGESAPTLEAAISNSFAFGGTNATLVLRRVGSDVLEARKSSS